MGTFTGTIVNDDVTMVLRLSLTNTSPVADGAYIVAGALNIADADDDATGAFVDVDNPAGVGLSFSPFGDFEFGVSLAGTPGNGIGVGETGIFNFNITEPDGEVLTASDFLSEVSVGDDSSLDAALVLRFQGINTGTGSDKVPAKLATSGGGAVVPLPRAAWEGLAMLGFMACVGAYRRQSLRS